MADLAVLSAVIVTSAIAWLLGATWLRLKPADLLPAARRAVECVGLLVGFFVVNLAVGMGLVIVGRRLLETFVSMYFVNDASLLGISLLQALLFQWWRESRRTR